MRQPPRPDARVGDDGDVGAGPLGRTRGGGGLEVFGTETHGDLRALAQAIERDARHGDEQIAIERDLPVHDPARHGQRQLHHLVLGLMNHLRAQRGELVERLGQPAQHDFPALAGGLAAGPLALREALGKRVALDGRAVAPRAPLGRPLPDFGADRRGAPVAPCPRAGAAARPRPRERLARARRCGAP